MKKLNDIPKKEIFSTPENYFETLPGIVQSRVTTQKTEESFIAIKKLWFAIPVLLFIAVGIFWLNRSRAAEPEFLLASVEVQDLMTYLTETDLTTDELLDDITLNLEDSEELEQQVFESNFDADSIGNLFDEI